jgi:hypothetical protein
VQDGPLPYRDLIDVSTSIWTLCARASPIPYVPVVVAGWDPRPWGETIGGSMFWFERSPETFKANVGAALKWLNANPGLQPDRGREAPLLLIQAWNEIGEGAYIVPTREDGDRYGIALRDALHP